MARTAPRNVSTAHAFATRSALLALVAMLAVMLIDRGRAVGAENAPRLLSAVSRIQQAGKDFDNALPPGSLGDGSGTGIECRSIPRGGLAVVMRFDQPISGGAVSVSAGTATISGTPVATGNALRVNLTNVANAQLIALTASNVTPVSGGAAGSAVVRLRILEGDVNADGVVDQKDLDQVKAQATKNPAVNGFNYRSDANSSGAISGADVSSVKAKLGTKVAGSAATNTPPMLGSVANISATAGRMSAPVAFAVGDNESDPSSLAISVTSSNPTLVPDSNIAITGTGTSRTLTLTPAAKQTGSATLTVNVSDGLSVVSRSVQLDVAGTPTLYYSRMQPQGPNSLSSGTATVQLAADELSAAVQVNFSNLSSARTGMAVYAQDGTLMYDLAAATPDMFGVYTWTFADVPGKTAQQQVNEIKAGTAYVKLTSTAYSAGELRGTLQQLTSAPTFTPPAAPPALPGGTPTQTDAARLLQQATFGGTAEDVQLVQAMGMDNWLQQQFDTAPTLLTPILLQRQANGEPLANTQFAETWWDVTLTAPDQLRQRVAFALSQIFVVSQEDGDINERPLAQAYYYDMLVSDAFKNYRQIIEDVTLNPQMGNYLDMRGNVKANAATGSSPNENYAREILQLFSVGVNLLNPDGTLKLNGSAQPIPTYDQTVIQGFARVFTGWNYKSGTSTTTGDSYLNPMGYTSTNHETGNKALLSYSGNYVNGTDRYVIPAGQVGTKDLADALNHIFTHPNVGPFICKQLIQRLVTDNPSPGYVYRVVQKFNDNGQGVRGDMRAVVKAILTDYEARSMNVLSNAGFGHTKEPLVRATEVIRAFHPVSTSGYFKISITTGQLQQSPLDAPTVFNFFEPGFVYPGGLANNGMVAPEMQITDESTVVNYATFMSNGIGTAGGVGFFQSSDIRLDFTTEQGLTGNTTSLVNRLNLLLMANNMSDDPTGGTGMKQRITSFVNSSAANDKVQGAVYLISTAPEFCTQR